MPSAAGTPGQFSDPKDNKVSKAPEGYSCVYSSYIVMRSLEGRVEGRMEGRWRRQKKGGSENLLVSAVVSS